MIEQDNEQGSVPRRTLDLEDYLDILRRRKAWLFAALLAGLATGVVVAFLWPDTYVSTAVIRVLPPQVPERFVPTNVNTEMTHRVNLMTQAILSRTTLTALVETYNLYPSRRKRLPMDQIVARMRADIHIGALQSIQRESGPTALTAFEVAFSYEDRHLAQRVAQDLATRYVTESTRERAGQSAMTTQFLRDQWEQAKVELESVESRLARFNSENAGRLPDQWSVNLQQMNALESRLAAVNNSAGRAAQEKLLLESELRIAQDRLNALKKAPQTAEEATARDENLARVERDIRALERTLASLKESYRGSHPDVRRAQAQLGVLEREKQTILERLAAAETSGQPQLVSPQTALEIRDLESSVQKLMAQIHAKSIEAENLGRETQQIAERLRSHQRRVEVLPVSQQEYLQLQRERDLAQKRFDDLSQKMSQSEIASDLENRRQGEIMEMLDQANLPQRAEDPNRWIIVGAGLVFGLVLGFAMAGMRELKDPSLKSLKDVRVYTRMPILGSVPLLEDDFIIMRRRRNAWLAWSIALTIAAAAMSGSVYYYYATKL